MYIQRGGSETGREQQREIEIRVQRKVRGKQQRETLFKSVVSLV